MGVYTLRKGVVKLLRITADGRERIVRVLRPGDVIGLKPWSPPDTKAKPSPWSKPGFAAFLCRCCTTMRPIRLAITSA